MGRNERMRNLLDRGLRGALLGALAIASGAAAVPEAHAYSALYVFGDSLSDTGNLDLLEPPTTSEPPYYWSGRRSNGKVWCEYLAEGLGVAPVVASEAGGNNYAASGAYLQGVDPVVDKDPLHFSLAGQVEKFLADQGGVADPLALHVIWIGQNDVIIGGTPNTSEAGAAGIGLLDQAIRALHAAGARHFLVPAIVQVTPNPNNWFYNTAFNSLLPDELAALEATLPGSSFASFDASPILSDMFDRLYALGFTGPFTGAKTCTKSIVNGTRGNVKCQREMFNTASGRAGLGGPVGETYPSHDGAHFTTRVHREFLAPAASSALQP